MRRRPVGCVLAVMALMMGCLSHAVCDDALLPDGTRFEFWDDGTAYTRVYHVAQTHPQASDANPGTADRPFRTIGAAATVLRPGEKVVVHEGIYRECVRPARGGEGPDRMIAYEAAPGDVVCVRGSDAWVPEIKPSTGYLTGPVLPSGARRWMADLPPDMFRGYQPFLARNITSHYRQWGVDWYPEETDQFLLRRGMIFLNGTPLRQVKSLYHVNQNAGTFWMEEDGLRLHFRLPEGADPGQGAYEVSTREQVFAPSVRHLGYIRVSGFCLEHAAGPLPMPQRGLLSTAGGHHWIIEDNVIQWANGTGMDIGKQRWNLADYSPAGQHIVRRNTIANCGLLGIAGATHANGTLIEDNLIEYIGGLNLERIYVCGGLKLLRPTDVLIRRNVFRHISDATAIWLDLLAKNCRITGNVFADIESRRGAIHMEQSHDPDLIDGNIFWDIRTARFSGENEAEVNKFGGRAILGENCDNLVIAHNFFGKIAGQGWPIEFSLLQAHRIIGGRAGLGRRNQILNNVFVDCRKRLRLARWGDNISDGNLFDAAFDSASFGIRYLDPEPTVDLAAWQQFFGLDTHSTQARMEADFDPETLVLTWTVAGTVPVCQPVPAMPDRAARSPGPFRAGEWERSISTGHGKQIFPDPRGDHPAL